MSHSAATKSSERKPQQQDASPAHESAYHPGRASSYPGILGLQRAVGNRAVSESLRSDVSGQSIARPNLIVGRPEDGDEQEADRVAEQVMRRPTERPDQEHERLQTRSIGSRDFEQAAVPPIVQEILRSPGQPLDPSARAFMEARFGHDFSNVRVHADHRAARSAEAVRAQAYTVGSDVVFGPGRYAPASRDGQRLLAHELAHVVHQRGSSPRMQRKPDSKPSPGLRFRYSVKINKVLDGDQLLLEFIKQYRGIAADKDAAVLRDKENWRWVDSPPTVKQADVDKGYILITVHDPSITPGTEAEKKQRSEYFKGLAPGEQAAINAEVNREFWEKTQYRVGQELGTSAEDKQMAEYWKVLRDELVRKRQAIEALPPDIQKFLFDERASATLKPKDFETVLRIASKVAALTPAELAEYKSRVTAKTTDWGIYEASVDRFLAERKEREATAQERRNIETRLYGLEALYQRYRDYLSRLNREQSLAAVAGTDIQTIGASPTLIKMRDELDADLIKAGFPGGIANFEKFIRNYEKAFERETLAIARVMLDQYEHILWTQEQRYQNPAETDALHQSLSQTKARAEYEEAEKIRSEHAQTPWTLEEQAEQAYWVGQRNAALARGEAQVRSAADAHPLVSNVDFDRERLARASSPGETRSIVLDYIAARKKDIAETRKNLAAKPTMIYGLDKLLEASFQAQKIRSGTIYEKIIRDHISDVHWSEAIPQIILAIIAVAAGLLTGGGGTVAVLAAGTALGIGAYQAIEEFRRYEMKSAAYGAQLTSEDPTMAWVIVAVIGAGIDAAAFASVLPKLRPALEAFNAGAEAGDVAALERKLGKLTDVEEDIRKNIIRAAGAEAEARAAWKAIMKPAGLYSYIIPYADYFGRFVYAVYLSVKRGIREFQVFVKTNEAVELIGDVTKLTAEEMATLKAGYLKAIEEMEAVAAHGKALGMTDNEIRAFMNLRGNTKGMTVEGIAKEMDAWKATKGTGVPFGFQSVEQFEKFQATASAELKKLLKRADPNAEAFLQGSAVTGVSYKRHLPFDVESDFDVAVSSRYLVKQAEKLGYEVKLSPRRVGPLDPDQIAELGLGRFQERLGTVITEEAKAAGATAGAPPRKINIMLFDTAEAVKKPIGVSTETERAAVPLKVKK
jgi:hypothetical protein